MAWFLGTGRSEAGLRLASALWGFCHTRGHYEQGRAWLEDALSKGGGSPPLRARALTGAGVLAFLQCEYGRAGELLEQSLSLYEELADRRGLAEVTEVLGGLAREQGNYERARTLHEESLALWRELGDELGTTRSGLRRPGMVPIRIMGAIPLLGKTASKWAPDLPSEQGDRRSGISRRLLDPSAAHLRRRTRPGLS